MFGKFIKRGKRQEDWDDVRSVRNDTAKMIDNAKDKYLKNLGRKLVDRDQGPKTYWTVFNRLLNRKKVINIPPLLENGIFVTNVQTKASILNEFFVKQCSTITTGSTIPTFLPQCDEILQDLIIDREKVLQLIRSLNSNKAHGWDGISAHMIKLCDSSIVEPLCLIFEKCIETGKYPSIWKRPILSLFIKRIVDRIRRTIVQYRFCQSLVKCLRKSFLMLYTSTFVITAF